MIGGRVQRVFDRFARWLVERAMKRRPDFIIGGAKSPYMRRWWMLPRNPLFNIYVHEILRPDDDRALHDHPWPWASYLVAGAYTEVTLDPMNETSRQGADKLWRTWWPTGSFRVRGPWFAHRLEPAEWTPVWTVFITGPKLRAWGFLCPKGWVHWKKFTDPGDTGKIGRGCD